MTIDTYAEAAETVTGHPPYPWQARVAEEGLPELILADTGAGKTLAVILAWLWRRILHPDRGVRRATPHWLVYVLPMRVLTEQVESVARHALDALGLAERVGVHVAMGGSEDVAKGTWRARPEQEAIVIGTCDMLLSRALNRGFAVGRFSWPIDFGLLHNGTHFVYDEIQLLGPSLPTSRQLEGLRRTMGTAVPCGSTWMSATVDERGLDQVDLPFAGTSSIGLGDEDRSGGLRTRLTGTRRVEEVRGDVAAALLDAHRPATRTIAIVNTIAAARALASRLRRLDRDVPVTLLHSRFRPGERQLATGSALATPTALGRIIVSTQVLEAGVDVSADVMFVEAAPWPSIVQRAGRCNRDGLVSDARLLWSPPAKPAPYRPDDVTGTVDALRRLEGAAVTTTELRAVEVAVAERSHPVLRRADLLGLFDTAPDVSGNDIDVGPYIRSRDDDGDLLVAWRDLAGQPPPPDEARPLASELCPAPVRDITDLLSRERELWRYDFTRTGGDVNGWVRVRRGEERRPGLVVITDIATGGYTPAGGWDIRETGTVPAVPNEPTSVLPESLVDGEEAVDEDPVSYGTWVSLVRHLGDVEREVSAIVEAYQPSGLSEAVRRAPALAGRLHDVGKAHEVFQDTMLRSAGEGRSRAEQGVPWAKSGGARARHRRRYFRHELASALALLDGGEGLLAGEERDLVVYLVAAHHGRIRLSIRSFPDEERATALGVRDGESMPAVDLPVGRLRPTTLRLDIMRMGSDADGSGSWSARALSLLDQLGPFRLGFLEAAVRLGDWRASRLEAGGESDL